MPQQFPLIEKWMPGLRLARLVGVIDTADGHPTKHVFAAEDIEAELAKGLVVGGCSPEDEWYVTRTNTDIVGDTHEALLVGARPIKQETAEDLLRELIGKVKDKSAISFADMWAISEKAEAFFARSKA